MSYIKLTCTVGFPTYTCPLQYLHHPPFMSKPCVTVLENHVASYQPMTSEIFVDCPYYGNAHNVR